MTKREIHKTAAVVLSAIDYGESDRIVSFYSADFGKIKGMAKGAKNSRKRFANALEPFTRVLLSFSPSRGGGTLAFVEGCSVEDHYAKIRADFNLSLLASYMVELVERFTLEGKKAVELFILLSQFLHLLTRANGDAERLVRIFEIKFLQIMGYEPQLSRCVKCQMVITTDIPLQFDHARGGVRCPVCQTDDDGLLSCSAGARKTILAGRDIVPDKAERLFLSPAIARECEAVMGVFIRHLLGRELRSVEVLRQVRNLNRQRP